MLIKQKLGIIFLAISGIVAIIVLFLVGPIIQDENYHNFSDNITYFSVPNFWNVISNLPFLIVGVWGYIVIESVRKKASYFIFFAGITLIAVGSGYYHIKPDSNTLLWDRLPMTIVFMAIFSNVISEFISVKAGRFLLVPLLLAGIASVLVWSFGSAHDLRFYIFIQFFPMLAIPLTLLLFDSNRSLKTGYWLLLLAYVFAKLFEHFDYQVHHALSFMSGHSLKHIFAALGLFFFMNSYRKQIAKG